MQLLYLQNEMLELEQKDTLSILYSCHLNT